ncbi:unnamed protein product, partial [Prorocentrum cordatum]
HSLSDLGGSGVREHVHQDPDRRRHQVRQSIPKPQGAPARRRNSGPSGKGATARSAVGSARGEPREQPRLVLGQKRHPQRERDENMSGLLPEAPGQQDSHRRGEACVPLPLQEVQGEDKSGGGRGRPGEEGQVAADPVLELREESGDAACGASPARAARARSREAPHSHREGAWRRGQGDM